MKSRRKKGWLWGVKQRNRKKTKCAAARCGSLRRAEQHRITRQNTQSSTPQKMKMRLLYRLHKNSFLDSVNISLWRNLEKRASICGSICVKNVNRNAFGQFLVVFLWRVLGVDGRRGLLSPTLRTCPFDIWIARYRITDCSCWLVTQNVQVE